MSGNKVNQLKQQLGAGARANKYRVTLNIPEAVPKDVSLLHLDVLCKSASFPERSIGVIETWNQGRKLPLPGDTSYSTTWTLTFYNTEEHNIRRAFLEWMRAIDHFQDNMHSGAPEQIMCDMKVEQLDSAENVTVTYILHNCWPQQVSEVTVGDDQENQITEFTVTMTFSDFITGEHNVLDKPLEYHHATRNHIS